MLFITNKTFNEKSKIEDFIFLYYPKKILKILYYLWNGNLIKWIKNVILLNEKGYNKNDIMISMIDIIKNVEDNDTTLFELFNIKFVIEKKKLFYIITKLYESYNNLNSKHDDEIEIYYCFTKIYKKMKNV